MSSAESCRFCDIPIQPTVQHPSSNSKGFSVGQGRTVESVEHFWSYFYHKNIRECFSPSTTLGGNEEGSATGLGLPKLTFSFSMGGATTADANGKDAAGAVRICEQCCESFEKLDQLHRELEAVKMLVKCQVLNISNRISQGNISIQSILPGSLGTLDMSFGGSTIGKENVSKALRFLGQLCNDDRPPSTLFLSPNHRKTVTRTQSQDQVLSQECQSTIPASTPYLGRCSGPVDNEPETVAHLQEITVSVQSQTMKQEDPSILSNVVNTSVEPVNTFPSVLSALDSSVRSTASIEEHMKMEVDIENAEYHTQQIKFEPEPEFVLTSADRDSEEEILPTAGPPISQHLSPTKCYSPRTCRGGRLHPSTTPQNNIYPSKKSGGTRRKFGNSSTETQKIPSEDNIPHDCRRDAANIIEGATTARSIAGENGVTDVLEEAVAEASNQARSKFNGNLNSVLEAEQGKLSGGKLSHHLTQLGTNAAPSSYRNDVDGHSLAAETQVQKKLLLQRSANQEDSKRCTRNRHRTPSSSLKEQGRISGQRSMKPTNPLISMKEPGNEETVHQCNICGKIFNRNQSLIRHRRIHTGKKPFKCSVCQKTFTDPSHLIRHRRIHTGEKPYKCQVCDRKFRTSSNLKEHESVHTGERPYECEICHQKFTQIASLQYHVGHVHSRK